MNCRITADTAERFAMITTRKELPGDAAAVRQVHETAFGQADEADLVDALRKNCADLLSLVALDGDTIVGHSLWSPAEIISPEKTTKGMGLAPVGVLPAFQRKGIGTKLIAEGTDLLKQRGCPFVIVLGHPAYYPRFGFVPAVRYGIRSEWDMPEDAFLVQMLDPAKASSIQGTAKYRPEFSVVK